MPMIFPSLFPLRLTHDDAFERHQKSFRTFVFDPFFFRNSEYVLPSFPSFHIRSEEHTSELQSRFDLVCRLLLEKKKNKKNILNTELYVYLIDRIRRYNRS